jgi:hypothetical protein
MILFGIGNNILYVIFQFTSYQLKKKIIKMYEPIYVSDL